MTTPFHTVSADWLKQSVVEIRLDGSAGSGFTWGFDVVVTNARDLAVIDVPGLGLPAVRRRDPQLLRPGEALFAIGHPLGILHALSWGILHGVGPLPDGYPVAAQIRRRVWVQADLRLSPGNSGGPLADTEGRVVGINTMIVGGLALAVPIVEVEALVRQRAA